VSGHFRLPNRIYHDNIFAVGTFHVVQQEISRQCFLLSGYFLLATIVSGYFLLPNRKYPDNHFLLSGYFLLGNFVGIFPFGTMSGCFLLGVSGQVRSPRPTMQISIIFDFIGGHRSDKKSPEQWFINVAGSQWSARFASDSKNCACPRYNTS
jgi:hypothetical protein